MQLVFFYYYYYFNRHLLGCRYWRPITFVNETNSKKRRFFQSYYALFSLQTKKLFLEVAHTFNLVTFNKMSHSHQCLWVNLLAAVNFLLMTVNSSQRSKSLKMAFLAVNNTSADSKLFSYNKMLKHCQKILKPLNSNCASFS